MLQLPEVRFRFGAGFSSFGLVGAIYIDFEPPVVIRGSSTCIQIY